MVEPTRERFLIGGMDAGIEELLLDAGGEFLFPKPQEAAQAPGPQVAFRYGPSRRRALDTALGICRDQRWLLSSECPEGSVVVAELHAVRLLRRLDALGAAPDAVIVRSVDLLPAQVRGLREALSAGTVLEVSG